MTSDLKNDFLFEILKCIFPNLEMSPYFSCSDSWIDKLMKIFIKYSV